MENKQKYDYEQVQCNNCRYYKPNELNDGENGQCRRNAPVLDSETNTRFPTVAYSDKCGEFKHMITEPECITCIHYHAKLELEGKGECTRHAPQLLTMRNYDGDMVSEHGHPVVREGDHCGEWTYDQD